MPVIFPSKTTPGTTTRSQQWQWLCCPQCLEQHLLATIHHSWALALFFQVRSPLIFHPWIAIALSLILPIFRFAHGSIALKKPVVCSWKRALNRSIAPKAMVVCSFYNSCTPASYPPPAWQHIIHTVQAHTTYETDGKIEKTTIGPCFASF